MTSTIGRRAGLILDAAMAVPKGIFKRIKVARATARRASLSGRFSSKSELKAALANPAKTLEKGKVQRNETRKLLREEKIKRQVAKYYEKKEKKETAKFNAMLRKEMKNVKTTKVLPVGKKEVFVSYVLESLLAKDGEAFVVSMKELLRIRERECDILAAKDGKQAKNDGTKATTHYDAGKLAKATLHDAMQKRSHQDFKKQNFKDIQQKFIAQLKDNRIQQGQVTGFLKMFIEAAFDTDAALPERKEFDWSAVRLQKKPSQGPVPAQYRWDRYGREVEEKLARRKSLDVDPSKIWHPDVASPSDSASPGDDHTGGDAEDGLARAD